jgi:large subunit ribosomal protein L17
MRHRVLNIKLGRKKNHTRALLRNLLTSLLLHERITTTEQKAKALQPMVERLISSVQKKEDREAIRTMQRVVFQEEATRKALKYIRDRFTKRTSGFTRITPVGVRPGDAASMVQIEFVS